MKFISLFMALVFCCASFAQSVPHKRPPTPIQNDVNAYLEGTVSAEDLAKALLRDDSRQGFARAQLYGQPVADLEAKIATALETIRTSPVTDAVKVAKLKDLAPVLSKQQKTARDELGQGGIAIGAIAGFAITIALMKYNAQPNHYHDQIDGMILGVFDMIGAMLKIAVGTGLGGVAGGTLAALVIPKTVPLADPFKALCEEILAAN